MVFSRSNFKRVELIKPTNQSQNVSIKYELRRIKLVFLAQISSSSESDGFCTKDDDSCGVPVRMSPLSDNDKTVIGTTVDLAESKDSFGNRLILKYYNCYVTIITLGLKLLIFRMIRSDPKCKDMLFPKLKDVSVSELESHPEFIAIGNMVGMGLKFMLTSDEDFLKIMGTTESTKSYFAPDVPLSVQLEV